MKILDWAQTDIKIEHLAQRDVERANAAANGRGERSLDADEIFFEGFDGVIREPVVELGLGGLAREDLEPGNLLLAAVSLLHRRIKDLLAGLPNVPARAVATNERDDRIIRDGQDAVFDRNFAASGRSNVFVCHKRRRLKHESDLNGKKIVRQGEVLDGINKIYRIEGRGALERYVGDRRNPGIVERAYDPAH